jgi:dipeptidyl aminopeptidase/acylaminoacyl peptidase
MYMRNFQRAAKYSVILVLILAGSAPSVSASRSIVPAGRPATSPSAPVGSAEIIAFVDPQPDGVGTGNIWTMDLNGDNPTQLTTHASEDRWPAVSPDGSTIVWTSRHSDIQQLWHMDSDGSDKAAFANAGNNHRAIWSHNGSKIAYSSDLESFWEVWVMDADGRRLVVAGRFANRLSGLQRWSQQLRHLHGHRGGLEPNPHRLRQPGLLEC